MISEPINWLPSMFMGDGNDTIDATVANTFSCEINCTGYIYAYELVIMQNDTDSTVIYTSDPVRLDTAYAPRNNHGKAIPLEIEVPSNSGMTNGYENGYKWHLLLWEVDEGASADKDTWHEADHYTTRDYLFYAKAGTTVEVDTTGWDPSVPVTSKSKVFNATYSSPDFIQWFRWNLAIVNEDGTKEVVYTTDKIYSFNTTFEYDNLITGNTYAIQVEVYNQGSIYQQSNWVTFDVSYDVLKVTGMTECSITDQGVEVTWSSACYIQGVAKDDYGNVVQPGTWGESDYKYGLLQNWPVDGKYSLEMESGVHTEFTSSTDYDVEVDLDGTIVLSVLLRPYEEGTRQNVFRLQTNMGIVEGLDHVGFVSGLTPGDELTPSSSLAPANGSGGMFVYSGTGYGSSLFIDADDKYFLTSHDERLVVSDKTTYYPTPNPMSTVYTIVIYQGELQVIEHEAPQILPSHHVIPEGA